MRNWPEYDAGLGARGDLEIWFDEDTVTPWEPALTGKRGAPRRYSDTAIVTALTLRQVLHLPLRQAEGFVASLLRLMELDLEVPDHSTLSRRGQEVEVTKLTTQSSGPIHLIVNSTGLKFSVPANGGSERTARSAAAGGNSMSMSKKKVVSWPAH